MSLTTTLRVSLIFSLISAASLSSASLSAASLSSASLSAASLSAASLSAAMAIAVLNHGPNKPLYIGCCDPISQGLGIF